MTSIIDRIRSPEGRLSQQGYALGFVAPLLAMAGLTWAMIVGWLDFLPIMVVNVMALGWVVLLFVVGDAMNIRRYHDIGNSGRLYRLCRPGVVVLPTLAFIIDFFIPAQMASAGDHTATLYMISEMMSPTMSPITIALLVIPAVGVLLNFFYLIAMPGQTGPNDYGDDPRGGSAIPGAPRSEAGVSKTDDDPVKRALADYQKRATTAASATPASRATSAATFGKKRA